MKREPILLPRHRRMRAAWQLIFWTTLLAVLALAVMPHPPHIPLNPTDKLQHMFAFAVLTGLAFAAFPRATWLGLLVSLSGLGALIEFVQMIPALHRDAELLDWIADTTAIGATLLISMAAARVRLRPIRLKSRS